MGNTLKEATVPAPARRVSLRARTLRSTAPTAPTAPTARTARIVARSALTSTRAALAAALAIIAAAVAAVAPHAGPVQAAVRDALAAVRDALAATAHTLIPAPARARIRAGVAATARVVAPVAEGASAMVVARAARVSSAIPGRAKAPVAATAVLAVAGAVTAAATAVGPAAAAGPVGPAIAAAALRPAPAAAPAAAAAQAPAAHSPAAAHSQAVKAAVAQVPGRPVAASASHVSGSPSRVAGPASHIGGPARPHHHVRRHLRWVLALNNWHAITEAAAGHPAGGPLTPAQQLLPAPLAGAQATMPITPGRAASAALITAQALRLHMGIRSAVIAVATAMQESTLENLNYGDRDSLGLFQQRPSAGWGTPAQITDPIYAADAFLSALRAYQAADPAWATQPLWRAAQNVQGSAFPYAYAQWEDQAAQVVAAATRHLL
jgi:hypothetical protein